MPACLYNDLMLQYTQDAQTTETPWELWEYADLEEYPLQWKELSHHPRWYRGCAYRRKPTFAKFNGISIPVPVQVAPPIGAIYWIPMIEEADYTSSLFVWAGSDSDFLRLKRGLVHRDKEAAVQHAKALLSFTENL